MKMRNKFKKKNKTLLKKIKILNLKEFQMKNLKNNKLEKPLKAFLKQNLK